MCRRLGKPRNRYGILLNMADIMEWTGYLMFVESRVLKGIRLRPSLAPANSEFGIRNGNSYVVCPRKNGMILMRTTVIPCLWNLLLPLSLASASLEEYPSLNLPLKQNLPTRTAASALLPVFLLHSQSPLAHSGAQKVMTDIN